jgi:hypothetical protein
MLTASRTLFVSHVRAMQREGLSPRMALGGSPEEDVRGRGLYELRARQSGRHEVHGWRGEYPPVPGD